MKIELQPWMTPNFITGVMPVGKRQDGFNPDAAPKWHIRDVDAETLAEQCDRFRAEIFKKAGKIDPANTERIHGGMRNTKSEQSSTPLDGASC